MQTFRKLFPELVELAAELAEERQHEKAALKQQPKRKTAEASAASATKGGQNVALAVNVNNGSTFIKIASVVVAAVAALLVVFLF